MEMHVLLQLIWGVFVNNNHFSHRTRFSVQANVAIHIFLHLPAGNNHGESWELRRAEFLLKYQRCVSVRDLYCNIPSFWQHPNLYPRGPLWRMLALCLTEKNSLKGCSNTCCPWAILLLRILWEASRKTGFHNQFAWLPLLQGMPLLSWELRGFMVHMETQSII